MQEVSCFHCNSTVQITPNADHCSVCSEDLSQLLEPEYVSSYFYDRATNLATDGNMAEALAESERGLGFQPSSDLHLLAAILAQQLGQFDQMRQHVAQIPVGDVLRPEAEWMLRSHQARQRALREGARAGGAFALSTHGQSLEAALGHRERAVHEDTSGSSARPRLMPVVAVVLFATVVLGSWWWMNKGAETLSGIFAGEADVVESTPLAPAADAVETPDIDTGTPTVPVPGQETEDISPTSVPTISVPDNLVVQTPTEAPELVDSDLRRAVIVPADVFDLTTFLNETGYLELAALPIDARVQDDKLILQGIVHTDLQRRRLLASVQTIQGIGTVNAVDLLLRPTPTYTVREGDTLWSIVYDIYGDVERMDDFYRLNTDVLPSRDAINVGMVLKVPPLE